MASSAPASPNWMRSFSDPIYLARLHQLLSHLHRVRMVGVLNKDLLSWYLITLKAKETVEAGVVLPSSSHSIHPLPGPLNVVVEEGSSSRVDEHKTPPDSEWVVSIRDKLDQACQDDVASTWAKLCIYKVPQYLRKGDDTSYVPQIASIGPYHHGKKRLRSMDRHKWRSLQQVLRRTEHDVKTYLNALKEIEDRIRACYEGPISFGSDEFVEMVLLDGCFILELFRGAIEGFKLLGYPGTDPVFAMRGSMHTIQRDLIMLENQLPLFVLDLLLGIQLGQPDLKGVVSKLALWFFDPLIPTALKISREDELKLARHVPATYDPLLLQDSLHCLEVFRRGLLMNGPRPEPGIRTQNWSHWGADKRQQLQLIHSVTELREAGIKFKRRKTDHFWDVKFQNGILEIPRLFIHEGTKSLFLNLIAFEQCHLDCSSDVTSYVIFMDNLINSPEDVKYLHYCGIIEHWLGSDAEVSDLFNSLCQEVVFYTTKSYLSPLSEEVSKYFNRRWNTWRATLKRNYFSNPWAIISLMAAVILLLLTFAQTFYTVYGYY